MPRSIRYEYQGAIHLVTVNGYSHGQVFYQPNLLKHFPENPRGHAPDAVYFENLLCDTCEQYDAQIHGYAIASNTATAVIRTARAPLSWIAHDILGRYSKRLLDHHRVVKGQKPFPRRYRAQLVQPENLPYVIRHVQRRHAVVDERRRAINHPFSSELIYCGRKAPPKSFVLCAIDVGLRSLGYFGSNAYFEFMGREDTPAIEDMLSRRVIGEDTYAESLRRDSLRPIPSDSAKVPTPDDILRAVTSTVLYTDLAIAYSSTHRGALARALVAWYAMRTGAAQIGAVARWFGVTSSALRYLIQHHRKVSPHYFSRSLLELFPAP